MLKGKGVCTEINKITVSVRGRRVCLSISCVCVCLLSDGREVVKKKKLLMEDPCILFSKP